MDLAQSMSGISDELTADKLLDAYAKTNIFKEHWNNNVSDAVDDNKFSVVDGGTDVEADAEVTTPPLSPAIE